MARPLVGYAASLAAAAIGGLVNVAGRVLLTAAPTFVVLGAAYLLAALALLPFARGLRFDRRDAPLVATAIATGGVIAPALFFSGIARTTAVNASLLVTTEIVFTGALAAAFLGERLARRELAGASALLGAAIVVATAGAGGFGGGTLAGNLLVLGGAFAFSVDNVLSTRVLERTSAPRLVAAKALAGGLVLGGASLALGEDPTQIPRSLLPLVAFLGLAGVAAATILFFVSLRHVGAARTSMVFSSSAFFGAAGGALLLDEPFTGAHVAASVLLAVGLPLLFGGTRPPAEDKGSSPPRADHAP